MTLKILNIKKTLVSKLWLPIAKEGGNKLFPRLKKHKKMKLFTLTETSYEEIKTFEQNKLIKREDIVAWNFSHQQAFRLETELGKSTVLYDGRFEDTFIADSNSIFNSLQCEIINLDFTSQSPQCIDGRLENEIIVQSIIIKWLNSIKKDGLVLIYTTLLDDIEIKLDKLNGTFSKNSQFLNSISDIDDKIKFINTTFNTILSNNNYDLYKSDEIVLDIDNSTYKIFSRACIILRSV